MSKFTKRIDQTLEHIRNKADWKIAKKPVWVLQTKLLDQPWWTKVLRRYCVACDQSFGGGEAWSVLVNMKLLQEEEGEDVEGAETKSVNVCSHCAPTESLLATRLNERHTVKNILSLS